LDEEWVTKMDIRNVRQGCVKLVLHLPAWQSQRLDEIVLYLASKDYVLSRTDIMRKLLFDNLEILAAVALAMPFNPRRPVAPIDPDEPE
jgi:hypothetical protein